MLKLSRLPGAVVLDSAGQDSLDITSAEVLKGLLVELKDKGIEIYVAELHGPVREFGQRTGLIEMIGEDHIFPTVDAAVRFIEQSAPFRESQSRCVTDYLVIFRLYGGNT